MSETLKKGWRRVKFGEVVRLVSNRCAEPAKAGIERYVGLEHIAPGDLRVRSWGSTADGTTFTNRFRPGHVLFGKRRAYQRKVAVADFEGVCSGDIYVFESADPGRLLPALLPFICQTDRFIEHAVRTSAGSLSPRTNWTSLAGYEFALPPVEEQRRLASALHAATDVSETRREAADRCRIVRRAAIDDAFEMAARLAYDDASGFRITKLSDATTKIVDGVHKRPNYVDEGVPFLTVENLTAGPGVDFSKTRFVTQSDHIEFSKRAGVLVGDVLVSKDGTLGVARVIEDGRPFSIFVSIALLRPDARQLDSWFLRYFFDSSLFLRKLASKTSGSALKHIHLVDFRNTELPLPPMGMQRSVVERLRQIDQACESAERSRKHAGMLSNAILEGQIRSGS